MPSPFPGMNPYLEQDDVWEDFHHTYLVAVRERLTAQVAPTYIVKVEQYLFIHEPSAEHRMLLGHADVGVSRTNGGHGVAGATATASAPARLRFPSVEFEKHLCLEIRDRLGRDLVTVIEMLSPTNKKSGPDRDQYLAKRANLVHSAAHFVEIDLLRGGPKMPMEPKLEGDYFIIVSRVEDRPEVQYWSVRLCDSLPKIPIPLRSPHADAELDLQAVLHRVYDSAGYGNYIYCQSPNPKLSAEDAAWAASFLPVRQQ